MGECLRRALRDFYEESWRFLVLNALLTGYVLLVLAIALYVPVALVLLLGAGPLAAVLVAAATTMVDEGSFGMGDVAASFRRTWRRGVELGAVASLFVLSTVLAVAFYSDSQFAWPLAVVVLYVGGIFALYQLLLWPLAMREPGRSLRSVAREAGIALVQRPRSTVGLGAALAAINLAGLVLGALPFLTMTIAYSALAAVRFTTPRER